MGRAASHFQPSRNHPRKTRFPKKRTWIPCLAAIVTVLALWNTRSGHTELSVLRGNKNVVDTKDMLRIIQPPSLPEISRSNEGRTLYLIPGRENECTHRYDYICKFWFYIRCYVFGGFSNVEMLSLEEAGVSEFKEKAREGDIALVIWRSKNHSLVPYALEELLEWRKNTFLYFEQVPRVRIGVLHIANEVNRTDWPWYTLPDFIIRNYWIPNMPPHVMYIPLGPQLPNACTPRSTTESVGLHLIREPVCECNTLGFKKASRRRYVWNFMGSLRKKRPKLLRSLRMSPTLRDKGYVEVVKKFGGNGVFGSISRNPKNTYLDSILESQFVFAPCGNAMETHRIYEALALGAIPVIENCDPAVSHFFPFRELIIDGEPEQMVKFVEQYLRHPDEVNKLQMRVSSWWLHYADLIARNVSIAARKHVPNIWKHAP